MVIKIHRIVADSGANLGKKFSEGKFKMRISGNLFDRMYTRDFPHVKRGSKFH